MRGLTSVWWLPSFSVLSVLGLLGCPAAPPEPAGARTRASAPPRRPPPGRAPAPVADAAPRARQTPPRRKAPADRTRRAAPAVRAVRAARVPAGAAVRRLVATAGRLVAHTAQGRLQAWSLPALEQSRSLGAPGKLRDVDLSADGRWLLLTAPGGTNLVYDLRRRPPKRYRRWKRKAGRSQALSSDGKMLLRGDVRGQVRGYELRGYKMKWLVKAEALRLAPDGKTAAVLREGTLRPLDAITGRRRGKPWSPRGKLRAFALRDAAQRGAARLVAYVKRPGGCALARPRGEALALPCLAHPTLRLAPRGDLLTVAGRGQAVVVDTRAWAVLHRHGRDGATLRATPVGPRSWVVANLEPGRLSLFSWGGCPSPPPRANESRGGPPPKVASLPVCLDG